LPYSRRVVRCAYVGFGDGPGQHALTELNTRTPASGKPECLVADNIPGNQETATSIKLRQLEFLRMLIS
jgi:hypothetical protein